jgi:hypothetical protein
MQPGCPSQLTALYGGSRMDRIRLISKRLQVGVLIIMALIPGLIALYAMSGMWTELLDVPLSIPLDTSKVYGARMLFMVTLASIKPAANMIALWFLYKLLGLYRRGIIFTAKNVAAIRRIGWALASINIAGIIQTLITGPVLTFYDITPSHMTIPIEIDFLVVGIFIVLVSHVMDMGRELQEHENLVI